MPGCGWTKSMWNLKRGKYFFTRNWPSQNLNCPSVRCLSLSVSHPHMELPVHCFFLSNRCNINEPQPCWLSLCVCVCVRFGASLCCTHSFHEVNVGSGRWRTALGPELCHCQGHQQTTFPSTLTLPPSSLSVKSAGFQAGHFIPHWLDKNVSPFRHL